MLCVTIVYSLDIVIYRYSLAKLINFTTVINSNDKNKLNSIN